MKSALPRLLLGAILASGMWVSPLFAEETAKALPTLLIKGEVVSVDSNDPSAVLLKVKDRYGFETPIYLPQEAKISQGDAVLAATNLTPGTAVEVEYNFDINTAKRHAVSVKVAVPTPPAETAAAPAAVPAPVAEPAAPAAAEVLPPTPATPPPAEPAAPAPAPDETDTSAQQTSPATQ